MRMVLTIIGVVVVLYVGLTLLLVVFQERLIYFPIRTITATPATIGLEYEPVQIETEDGYKLSGWFVPAEDAANVVLYFHGNAGNISHRLESIAFFHRLGLTVLIIDYRGYGQSEGRPSEAGTYHDAEAAWRYLIETKGFKPQQIIIFGRSLGGAVAAWLAQQHRPRALILESTFTSIPDMGARQFPFLPVRALARIDYNTQARLPYIHVPILIVHSPDDEVIPYSHGRQLFEVANEPKEFLQLIGGHNEGFIISENYEAGINSFLQTYSDGK